MNRASILRRLLFCVALTVFGTGCNFYHNLGTGAHMDAPRNHPYDTNPTRKREMVVDVTTDAEGNVVQIHFQRSSGKDGIDEYVADSIRQTWPRLPSTKSVASLTYSSQDGFSSPKIISSTPL